MQAYVQKKAGAPFTPLDLLKSSIFLHVFATVIGFRFLAVALFMSRPHQGAALAGAVLFIWALRSRRSLASFLFLFFSVAFWLAIILPWTDWSLWP